MATYKQKSNRTIQTTKMRNYIIRNYRVVLVVTIAITILIVFTASCKSSDNCNSCDAYGYTETADSLGVITTTTIQ